MEFKELIEKMNPEIYQNLKTAIELGKWPNGLLLTDEQKEISMQALISYEIENNFPENQRIGFIDTSKKEKTSCNNSSSDSGTNQNSADDAAPIKWKH